MNNKTDDDIIPRKTFFQAYKDSALALLTNTTKDNPILLEKWLNKIIQQFYKELKCTYINNEHYGSAELCHMQDTRQFFNKYNQYVLSPSGSVYFTIDKKKSMMYEFIKHYLDSRKVYKKEMLKAKERNDITEANIKNYNQATMKIRANSIIGGTGSEFSFCYNKAAFNSVTSLSRNCIMNAYAFTERFLASNFYFPTYNHILNYISVCIQKGPDEKSTIDFINKFPDIYIPSADDILKLFISYAKEYTNKINGVQLRCVLNSLTKYQLLYLYYASNMYLFFVKNRDIVLPIVRNIFNDNNVDFSNISEKDPNDLFKFDGDLLIVLNTHYAYILPKGVSMYDTPKEYPEIAQKLVCIAEYMTNAIQPLLEILSFFCNRDTSIENTIAHKFMYRKAVANSDTDSVIFTTKEWVKWYTGNYNFTQQAFDIDALTTFLLSKSVAWLMMTISKQRGSKGKDRKALNMKNEFLYPVMMSCIIPKHYAGPITMQEGKVLPKPDFDIKGVSFRGSAMQKITLDYVTNFIKNIIDDIYDKNNPDHVGTIRLQKYILKVIQYECHILKSLQNGEMTYLNIVPIRNETEYANSDSSIWFNYLIWKNVFEETYGEIQIPNKCHVVPLITKGIKNEEYLSWLNKNSPIIYTKLTNYLQTIDDKKNISRIPINPILTNIPMELVPLIDKKLIAYSNCSPLYLALESFGVSTGVPSKKNMLFVDFYGIPEEYIYG